MKFRTGGWGLVLMLVGCGGISSRPTATTTTFSSIDLYQNFLAASSQLPLASLRAMETEAYFQGLTRLATDEAIAIPELGIDVRNTHSLLVAQASTFKLVSKAFPTMGDMMDVGLVGVPGALSFKDFTAALQLNHASDRSNLALVAMPSSQTFGMPAVKKSITITPKVNGGRVCTYKTTNQGVTSIHHAVAINGDNHITDVYVGGAVTTHYPSSSAPSTIGDLVPPADMTFEGHPSETLGGIFAPNQLPPLNLGDGDNTAAPEPRPIALDVIAYNNGLYFKAASADSRFNLALECPEGD